MLPRINCAVAVACLAAFPVTIRADESAAAPTALDEATFLKKVVERSPRRAVLDQRVRAARAGVDVAGQLPNPTLSYEREAVSSLSTSDDFIRLGWTLDVAGRRGLATQAANAEAEAERLTSERDRFLLENDARQIYLDAVYARERVARLDQARVPLAELVAVLRSRVNAGDASSYDADRATLELDDLDDERATALRVLEVARLRLGAAQGEPGTPYEATGALALPLVPGSTQIAIVRPDVDAARARATQADRERSAAARGWVPRLELMGGLRLSTSNGQDGTGYVVGVGGELPVFNAGGAQAERSRADAKRWRLEAEALANEARGQSEQARRELVLRIEQANRYLAGPAVRAVDLLRRAGVAYREGDRPILELLDVLRSARHAALRSAELVYEARRADLQLARVLGRTP